MRQESTKPEYGIENEKEEKESSTNIAGPVAAWIILLFVSLAIKFVVTSGILPQSGPTAWLGTAANFILGTPGQIILPLVVGAAIGAEVGIKAASLRKAEKSGILNGVYAAVVYTVGVIIIYEVLTNLLPAVAPTLGVLFTFWFALPIIICIAVTEVFAILSFSRKVNG